MDLNRGCFVQHPAKPDWGIGEVIAADEQHTRVFFSNAGEKIIDNRYVTLKLVAPPEEFRPGIGVLPSLDIERIRSLCNLFVSDLKDNRATYNDASLAENVMKDIERLEKLSRTSARQLAAWCTTNGSVFQKGVPLAQDISRAIYGRVLRREDVDSLL